MQNGNKGGLESITAFLRFTQPAKLKDKLVCHFWGQPMSIEPQSNVLITARGDSDGMWISSYSCCLAKHTNVTLLLESLTSHCWPKGASRTCKGLYGACIRRSVLHLQAHCCAGSHYRARSSLSHIFSHDKSPGQRGSVLRVYFTIEYII